MTLAWISLLALFVVIVLSCTNRVHPGFLALALAWVIGVYVSPFFGVSIDLEKHIFGSFPTDLFLTLTGVSLLFTQAHLNGTLDKLAHAAVGVCRGNVGLIPWMFFLLAAGFATAGAGNIAAAALIAPTAMTLATKARIPAILMTLLVSHGALAGALSPISPTGIIAEKLMAEIGLHGYAVQIFVHNLLANFAVAALGFLLFGGLPLCWRWYDRNATAEGETPSDRRLAPSHWATLALIAALMIAVLVWKVNVGMGAFACAVILALTGLADDSAAVKKMPWSVILMVCGVNVLTALLDKTGGNAQFAELVASVSSGQSAPAVLGFIAAAVSVYASTSAVVLPTFLKMAAVIVEKVPGSDPVALALSVIVAGHLVDSSPLSTIGAICVASAGADVDRRRLFVQALLWGLAMAVVGAAWCYVLYGLFW
jgi:Na+/H+ antiporter NhaD/arsenite permease-like protein